MSTSKRCNYMSRKKRRQLVFTCILELIEEYGLFNVSIAQIAKKAECSNSTVESHFGGIHSIRETVLEYAMENNMREILDTPVIDMIRP